MPDAADPRGPQWVHLDASFAADGSRVVQLESLLLAEAVERKGGAADEGADRQESFYKGVHPKAARLMIYACLL